MSKLKIRTAAAVCIGALMLVSVPQAFARSGFSGGGFRSSPSLRPSSGGRSLGWGSATRPNLRSQSSGLGDSSSFAARRSIAGGRSSVSSQRGLYESAASNGTLFQSRAAAAEAFRGKYAQNYTSSFASEPASRPSYIPSTAFVGGRTVNIVYSPTLGGYGYYHPSLGRWILYDALADSVLDQVMYDRGYYWGSAPVYVSHGFGFLRLAFWILVILAIIAVIGKISARNRSRRW